MFGAYKDTIINMNWNTNVISTTVPGSRVALVDDLTSVGAHSITLAFATGECGSENWGGVPGAAMASANAPALASHGIDYILSTGGAAGSFTCGSDAGMNAFIGRWATPHLIGVDFDIEAGQSPQVISALVQRIAAAHNAYPGLRFSLTLATLANNNGASTAQSLGGGAPDSFNTYGDETMRGGALDVRRHVAELRHGRSDDDGLRLAERGRVRRRERAVRHGPVRAAGRVQPARPLGRAVEQHRADADDRRQRHRRREFTLQNADAVASFAIAHSMAGVHYWSYDRDVDCAPGYASPTCNSLGNAGTHGFLRRFTSDGL